MRINLTTTFAEKDTVKALGARWDAAKKVWYITDVEDLTPFKHWIPSLKDYVEGKASSTAQQGKQHAKTSTKEPRRFVTGPAVVAQHCGCNVRPWEDCSHTALNGQPKGDASSIS